MMSWVKGAVCMGVGVGMALMPGISRAQVEARKYSNEFLEIGVGAAAAAMGGAYTAWAEDATAGFWNPAALVHLQKNVEVAAMHAEYFAGVAKYDFVGIAPRVGEGRRLAFSFVRLGVDDIPNTLNFRDGSSFNYSRITGFSAADAAFFISYGQQVKWLQGLSMGGSFKVVRRTAGPFGGAWGFGLDLAAHYRTRHLRLAATVRDVTSTFNAWSFNTETFADAFLQAGQEIPQNGIELTLPSVRLGGAYTLFPEKDFSGALVMELATYFDGQRNTIVGSDALSVDPRLGGEVNFRELVFLRGGVQNLQRTRPDGGDERWTAYPTAGVGLRLPIKEVLLQVDYALSNLGQFEQNLYSHLVSLRIAFNKLNLPAPKPVR